MSIGYSQQDILFPKKMKCPLRVPVCFTKISNLLVGPKANYQKIKTFRERASRAIY